MKVIQSTTKSLSVESDYGGKRDGLTYPKSTTCITMSQWLVDHIYSTLISMAHPRVDITKREDVAFKEAVMSQAHNAEYLIKLLRDFTTAPEPGVCGPNTPTQEECVIAINKWIVEGGPAPAKGASHE